MTKRENRLLQDRIKQVNERLWDTVIERDSISTHLAPYAYLLGAARMLDLAIDELEHTEDR